MTALDLMYALYALRESKRWLTVFPNWWSKHRA